MEVSVQSSQCGSGKGGSGLPGPKPTALKPETASSTPNPVSGQQPLPSRQRISWVPHTLLLP